MAGRVANQPESVARDDGLALTDCFVTAAVRCAPPANRPLPVRARQLPAAGSRRELSLLPAVRVIVCLGGFAWDVALRVLGGVPVPASAPAVRPRRRGELGRFTLLGCYHPSQQNTFTGRLTEPMMDEVLARARGRRSGEREADRRVGPGRPRALGRRSASRSCRAKSCLPGVRVVLEASRMAVAIDGVARPPDGLALDAAQAIAPVYSDHPNGATGIDHVVALTPDFDTTAAELERAGLPLRRIRDGGGFRQGFRRLGGPILELVEARGSLFRPGGG